MLNRRAGFHSSTWLLVTSCIGAALLLQAPAPAASGRAAIDPLDAIESAGTADPVQRFLARADEPVVQYRARRTLRARNERFNKEGWITARTELDPATGFTFQILEEGGSSYIRSRVLRKALEGERDAFVAGEPARAALSPANYRFSTAPAPAPAPAAAPPPASTAATGTASELRPIESSSAVDTLRIVPLRKDKLLVDGTITLAADGDLLRIEGRLVKNPSFWTNRVEIVRRYGRIEGIRVPLVIESTANVKIAGTSVFSMTYEYESINGRPVSPGAQAAATLASQRSPQ